MAKTIKEMAEDKYSVYEDAWMHKAYIEGANAALSEIESIIDSNEDNTLCMARCLVDKIRELKGGM